MPLVPLNTVQRWYRTDSWVYQAFAYTYQNPAWARPIPTGYSLCPYFWRAVIGGLFLVRILVWLTLGAKLIGRHGSVVGNTLIISMMVVLYGVSLHNAIHHHWLTIWVAVFSPLTTLLGSMVYIGKNEHNPKRCKVERYIVLSLILDAILLSVKYPVIWTRWPRATGHFLLVCAAWVGHAIAWMALKVAACFVWAFASSGLYIVGPSLGILLAAIVIDWYLNRQHPRTPPALNEPDGLDDWKTARNRFARWASFKWRYGEADSWLDTKWSRFIDRWLFGDSALQIRLRTPGLTDEQYKEIADQLWARYLAAKAVSDARWARLDGLCARVGEVVWVLLTPFNLLLWKPIRWIAAQGWTFLCLLWELWKARKQGICPYLPFSDGGA